MSDKQKAIEEMANAIPNDVRHANTTFSIECSGAHATLTKKRAIASALVNANFGNIPQALMEFAERLKEIGRNRPNFEGQFNGIGFVISDPPYVTNNEIDQTLKEFLSNADIPE